MRVIFLIISIILFLNAKTTIDGITIYSLPDIKEENKTTVIFPFLEINNTETNQTEELTPPTNVIKPKIDLAILINKKLFKKYLPTIINSINAYFLYKKSEFNLSVYDINQTSQALMHKNILVYTYNPNDVYKYQEFNNTFYFPMINKNDIEIDNPNFIFGGIDYFSQIKKLSELINTNKVFAINENTITSQKLFNIESNFFEVYPYEIENVDYMDLNNSYIFLNTSPSKSAQILSNIYYKNINPNLILSTQINYSPLIIALTQKEALNKFIVANSILNVPKELIDINMLLNSDIKFNYLNYAANILCNKIYNETTKSDNFYMNDFLIFIFNNQIEYHTKLYQVVFKAFKEILIE